MEKEVAGVDIKDNLLPPVMMEYLYFCKKSGIPLRKVFRRGTSKQVDKWFRENKINSELFTRVWLDTKVVVETSDLSVIPIPDLYTSDGKRQYLALDEVNGNYFASRMDSRLKQKFSYDELCNVPNFYKEFAVRFRG